MCIRDRGIHSLLQISRGKEINVSIKAFPSSLKGIKGWGASSTSRLADFLCSNNTMFNSTSSSFGETSDIFQGFTVVDVEFITLTMIEPLLCTMSRLSIFNLCRFTDRSSPLTLVAYWLKQLSEIAANSIFWLLWSPGLLSLDVVDAVASYSRVYLECWRLIRFSIFSGQRI